MNNTNGSTVAGSTQRGPTKGGPTYAVMALKGPGPWLLTPCTKKHRGTWAGSEVPVSTRPEDAVPSAVVLCSAGSRVGAGTEQLNTLIPKDWTKGYPG